MPTAGELVTQIRDMLDEPTAAQWTDDMLVRWINEAARDLGRATRYLKATDTIPLIAGTSEYALPTNLIAVEHAYYRPGDGRDIPLTPRHYEGMDQVWGQWQNQQSYMPNWFTVIGFSPSAVIKLYPAPNDSNAELSILYCRVPDELSIPFDSSEDADVPHVWYDAIVDYVESKALRRDRDPRWQEAYQLYVEKRDGFIHNPDYLAENREIIPTPNGYMPEWLALPEYWD